MYTPLLRGGFIDIVSRPPTKSNKKSKKAYIMYLLTSYPQSCVSTISLPKK